ncbi:unnamed protein product, partial [Symbiodinium sp. CCMP2456]
DFHGLTPPKLDDASWNFGNPGSSGHPEFCSRPCLHVFREGGCSRGVMCGHCHLHHSHRTKLDQLQRAYLNHLKDEERLAVFVPLIRRRASQMGLLPVVEKIVEMLETEAAPHNKTVPPNIPRCLQNVVQRMPLNQLIFWSMRKLPERVQVALQSTKSSMRSPQLLVGHRGPSILL